MDLINLADLNMSAGTQMRSQIDERVIDEYAEHLRELPPIIVFYDGSRYIPADGFQRIAAYSKCGEKQIPCEVKAGTVRDAILFAAGANATHGRRRTNADKRRAIETLLRDDEWRQKSDKWIADVVRVHHATVATVRAEMCPAPQLDNYQAEELAKPRRVQGQDGKTYTVPQRAEPRPQNPQKSPPVVQVIEEPISAPRVERQSVKTAENRFIDRATQLLAQLCDLRDDTLASGDSDMDERLSSLELAITHLDAARSTESQ